MREERSGIEVVAVFFACAVMWAAMTEFGRLSTAADLASEENKRTTERVREVEASLDRIAKDLADVAAQLQYLQDGGIDDVNRQVDSVAFNVERTLMVVDELDRVAREASAQAKTLAEADLKALEASRRVLGDAGVAGDIQRVRDQLRGDSGLIAALEAVREITGADAGLRRDVEGLRAALSTKSGTLSTDLERLAEALKTAADHAGALRLQLQVQAASGHVSSSSGSAGSTASSSTGGESSTGN